MRIYVRSLKWLPLSEDPNAVAPYPGIVVIHRRVKRWEPRYREALMAHERTHWWQYLRTAPLGIVPLVAVVALGVLSPWWLLAMPIAAALPLWVLYLPLRDVWEDEAMRRSMERL